MRYYIVYPRGDRSKLCVAHIRDYEASDYDLASREYFDTEDEAKQYMRELAMKHGKQTPDLPAYLD